MVILCCKYYIFYVVLLSNRTLTGHQGGKGRQARSDRREFAGCVLGSWPSNRVAKKNTSALSIVVLATFPRPPLAVPLPDPPNFRPATRDELTQSRSFALRFNGEKRVHSADETTARLTAVRLVEHYGAVGLRGHAQAGAQAGARPAWGAGEPAGWIEKATKTDRSEWVGAPRLDRKGVAADTQHFDDGAYHRLLIHAELPPSDRRNLDRIAFSVRSMPSEECESCGCWIS